LSVSETLYRLEVIIVRLTVNLSTKTQTPVVRRRHNQINMIKFVGKSFNW